MNIDKHIDEVLSQGGTSFDPKTATARRFDLCKIYTAVRPVLKFARGLLFFKPKWQSVISLLMEAMDEHCPNSNL